MMAIHRIPRRNNSCHGGCFCVVAYPDTSSVDTGMVETATGRLNMKRASGHHDPKRSEAVVMCDFAFARHGTRSLRMKAAFLACDSLKFFPGRVFSHIDGVTYGITHKSRKHVVW